jgi:hypothetical protein
MALTFPSPWVIDVLRKLDFDYVVIDGERGRVWIGWITLHVVNDNHTA